MKNAKIDNFMLNLISLSFLLWLTFIVTQTTLESLYNARIKIIKLKSDNTVLYDEFLLKKLGDKYPSLNLENMKKTAKSYIYEDKTVDFFMDKIIEDNITINDEKIEKIKGMSEESKNRYIEITADLKKDKDNLLLSFENEIMPKIFLSNKFKDKLKNEISNY